VFDASTSLNLPVIAFLQKAAASQRVVKMSALILETTDEELKAKWAGFSEKEKKVFREAFELFDHDGSGFITTDEIGVVMRRLGQNPSPKELENMVRDVDADGSGHIDFNEFLVMMSQTQEKHHQAELRQAFRLFDADGDGFITRDDLKRVMRNCGESLTNAELETMFTKADINKDNLVDLKEFTRIVSNE
ncbi:Calmodulin, partial [Acropora cervicornis]